MRSNEVCNEIKGKTPPNSAKDITSHLLHSSHQAYAVIHLRQELEQEYYEEDRHYQLYLLLFYQSWYD